MLNVADTHWPLVVLALIRHYDGPQSTTAPIPDLFVHLGADPGTRTHGTGATLHTSDDCPRTVSTPTTPIGLDDWFATTAPESWDTHTLCPECVGPLRAAAHTLGESSWLASTWIVAALERLHLLGAPAWGPRLGDAAPTAADPTHHLGGATSSEVVDRLAGLAYELFRGEHVVLAALHRSNPNTRPVGVTALMQVITELLARLRDAANAARAAGLWRRACWEVVENTVRTARMDAAQLQEYQPLFSPEEYARLAEYLDWVDTRRFSHARLADQPPAPLRPSELDTLTDSEPHRTWVLVDRVELSDYHHNEALCLLHADAFVDLPTPAREGAIPRHLLARVPTKLAYHERDNGRDTIVSICGADEGYDPHIVAQAVALLGTEGALRERFNRTVAALTAAAA